MGERHRLISYATRGVLVLFLFFLAWMPGCKDGGEEVFLKIGLPEEPRSLNPWLGTDANSRKILSLIYQPLYLSHPKTLKIIPWLAQADPVVDETGLQYTVKLRAAKWSDGSDFTSADVLFTRDLFTRFKIPRYYSKWKSIEKLEALDAHTLVFHLKAPSAIFMSRVLTAPMVSKKEWGPIADAALNQAKPLRFLQDHPMENPLGTGPFTLHEYKKGAFIHMKKNVHFFGKGKRIAGHDLGPYVENLLFRVYGTSDVAILALKKGDIDYFWWEIQPGYIKDLEAQPGIQLYFNKKSALYYLGFNLRREPFNDRALRRAVAMMTDTHFILTRILQNYGSPMHSIVPSGNHIWFNPKLKPQGENMDMAQRIRGAHSLLAGAGYTWKVPPVDGKGRIVTPSGIRMPSGEKMKDIVILTPPADYDPKRAFAGTMIQEWLKKIGIPASARPMAFNALLDTVKGKHEFDAFVLGYAKLNLDPDYLRAFFHSDNDRPRGWNMSGYKNSVFDQLADAQRFTIQLGKRREMIWEMQRILMEDLPYFPLYTPLVIEAVANSHFSGWVEKVDGIGNIWSMCMVRPLE